VSLLNKDIYNNNDNNNNNNDNNNDDNRGRPAFNVNISHENDAINEFVNFSMIMNGAFPHLFLHGYPFKGAPTTAETVHMMEQCSNVFNTSFLFIMYLFNVATRFASSKGVFKVWKSDPNSLQQLSDALNDDTFLPLLTGKKYYYYYLGNHLWEVKETFIASPSVLLTTSR
jgi:hypothetical protein